MLIAVLSDIHANVEALKACLQHARTRGAERYAFLGDFVGYGADPGRVVEIVAGTPRAVPSFSRATTTRRSRERRAISTMRRARRWNGRVKRSTPEQKAFLASLPLIVRDRDVCYVHASAAAPERWDYIDSPAAAKRCADAAEACYTFCGHVHDQVLYFENARGRMIEFRPFPGTAIPVRSHRRWVAIVGSVGQPRDRNPAAAYTLFDLAGQKLTFFRVPYDAMAAAEKIRQLWPASSLAYRVELGI